ncbi:Fur family transcriptional regulator [Celeribacter indicus]|uniref:Ferric uptake regulator family protein n=1 Tax=Celeribacter indicus TaxID=1208324 RepID=A0A0B5E7H2_9RHOB|nr:Fur family transcriptional regulator [Celeribacter indicus]AJE49016.1 ferric uptake regulator family protein [Celeribacter indicus]SDW43737.1 Fur family transcriptional regulator, zinc uptake regulator [Celeribacter indicus]
MDPNPIGFQQHDHAHCVQDAVAAAAEMCARSGLHFTPVRKRALEILLEEHRALGAYDVLRRLSEEGFGAQPPVAYRALDFLTKHGLAHKIERLNAFIACAHPGELHTPAFLICTTCNAVAEAETDPTRSMMGEIAARTGFRIDRAVLEAEGTCPNCLEKDAR